MDRIKIGINIRKFREIKNISQSELAYLTKIQQTSISRYEIGKITPTFKVLEKFAKALDVTVVELILGPEGSIPNKELSDQQKELVSLTTEIEKKNPTILEIFIEVAKESLFKSPDKKDYKKILNLIKSLEEEDYELSTSLMEWMLEERKKEIKEIEILKGKLGTT